MEIVELPIFLCIHLPKSRLQYLVTDNSMGRHCLQSSEKNDEEVSSVSLNIQQ